MTAPKTPIESPPLSVVDSRREKQAIIAYDLKNPLKGCRSLTF
jgi:hypothetical protein